MTFSAGLLADWRAAPDSVKAFVVVSPVAGFATEWAYSAHVRANAGPFVVAVVTVLLLMAAVIRRHFWVWVLLVVIFLADLTGVFPSRHPLHRPLPIGIALFLLDVVLLFSPPMLRWVGASQRWRDWNS